jgi:hypothetical protein
MQHRHSRIFPTRRRRTDSLPERISVLHDRKRRDNSNFGQAGKLLQTPLHE